jgi:PAS domain S-box-containing protein
MAASGANRAPGADPDALGRVEHAVAQIVAETEQAVEVYDAVLEAIGAALGWRLGAVWELDPPTGRLRCARTWHAGEPPGEFEALSATLTLSPGVGLPGRVLVDGRPTWLVDAPEDANFPRAQAARRGGLHAAFAFPLRAPRGVVGVMEFFAGELREPDHELLATMDTLGSQIGQFVASRRAAEELRARESRLTAMLDAALDAVVTMDAGGRVIGWNNAAEAIFGYRASEAEGREMAELIVPAHLRESHRRGLARYLQTKRGVVLDRRLELSAVRRDGTEFPVELTITRIGLPGPPTFTGYLRDITHRLTAERELRASRARLVEVADAERKRIQRNLHDGAQQRITSVLLSLGRLRAQHDERVELLEFAIDELAAGLDDLRTLASGLHPALLTERGLSAAIEALAIAVPMPVELEALPAQRLPEPVEAAGYYVVAEALANVQKHAGARRVVVTATADQHGLDVRVADDGAGGADADGHGLRGLADRVEALGGRLTLESPRRGGTVLRATIPRG